MICVLHLRLGYARVKKRANEMSLTKKQEKILLAMLSHAKTLGWTKAAIEQAAKDACGDPSYALLEFPNGLAQATESLSTYFDDLMKKAYAKEDISNLRTHERVAKAMELRFALLTPYHEAARSLLRYLVHPARLPLALKISQRTVSTIWYLAGDQSTDFNYYTKRFLLGYVYNTTFIHWARARKDPLSAAMAFMHKRLKDVSYIPRTKQKLKEWGTKLKNVLPHPFQKS